MSDIKDNYTRQVQQWYSDAPGIPEPLIGPAREPRTATAIVVQGLRIALATLTESVMATLAQSDGWTATLEEWLSDLTDWSDGAREWLDEPTTGGDATVSLTALSGRLQGSWAVREFYAPEFADRFTEVRQGLIMMNWAIEAHDMGKYRQALMFCQWISETFTGALDRRVTFANLYAELKRR